jgi:hypothetical protein
MGKQLVSFITCGCESSEKGNIDSPNTQIPDHSLSCLGTDTSMKSGGVKQVLFCRSLFFLLSFFLLLIVLSVLRFTDSVYPFGILTLAAASRVHPFCNSQFRARTHAVLVIGLYELLDNPTT